MPYLYGHANLYGLFLAAGLETLDEHGVLAALIPTSVTTGRYSCALREALSTTAPLREITFVAERDGVFSGVLQETCLATFTRSKPRKTRVSSINGQVTQVAAVASPRSNRPWLLPRRADDAAVAAGSAAMPLTLAAAGWRVSTGPLVWNRRRSDLHRDPGLARYPVVWAADIDGGHLHRDPARDSTRYLSTRTDQDRATMLLDQPAVLIQRTTAPEQTRRVVAVDLGPDELAAWGGRVVVENHVNVLRADRAEPLLTRRALARLLATPTIDRVVRCLAGSVAVSAFELESLPLPGPATLQAWNDLDEAALAAAVTSSYQPGAVRR